ncbi:hypothetical protein SAMN05444166_4327 [Singulisphaera sp. GP187]|nr:hypothetical protein SAMN05444166_4327 [Singulisphaera sp. GP187]
MLGGNRVKWNHVQSTKYGPKSIESVRLVILIFSGPGRFAYFSCHPYFRNREPWAILTRREHQLPLLSLALGRGEERGLDWLPQRFNVGWRTNHSLLHMCREHGCDLFVQIQPQRGGPRKPGATPRGLGHQEQQP